MLDPDLAARYPLAQKAFDEISRTTQAASMGSLDHVARFQSRACSIIDRDIDASHDEKEAMMVVLIFGAFSPFAFYDFHGSRGEGDFAACYGRKAFSLLRSCRAVLRGGLRQFFQGAASYRAICRIKLATQTVTDEDFISDVKSGRLKMNAQDRARAIAVSGGIDDALLSRACAPRLAQRRRQIFAALKALPIGSSDSMNNPPHI